MNYRILSLQIEDIEDIKQDASLTILKKIVERPLMVNLTDDESEVRYKQLTNYFIGAAQKEAWTLCKRRIRIPKSDGSGNAEQRELENKVINDLLVKKRREWLQRVINECLTPEQKSVIIFRLLGYSYKKIANILGIKERAAQDRYRRAIKKLQKLFRDNDALKN